MVVFGLICSGLVSVEGKRPPPPPGRHPPPHHRGGGPPGPPHRDGPPHLRPECICNMTCTNPEDLLFIAKHGDCSTFSLKLGKRKMDKEEEDEEDKCTPPEDLVTDEESR